jgi:hypothetical protein
VLSGEQLHHAQRANQPLERRISKSEQGQSHLQNAERSSFKCKRVQAIRRSEHAPSSQHAAQSTPDRHGPRRGHTHIQLVRERLGLHRTSHHEHAIQSGQGLGPLVHALVLQSRVCTQHQANVLLGLYDDLFKYYIFSFYFRIK